MGALKFKALRPGQQLEFKLQRQWMVKILLYNAEFGVFVALVTQHAVRTPYFVICGLSGITVFSHIIS
jgi:hypothetical protein